MPTYEYICLHCGTNFEIFHSMTASPLTECKKCGGQLKRLIGSGAGIIFKGSGFYETDYKKKSKPSEQTSTSSSEKKAEPAHTSSSSSK